MPDQQHFVAGDKMSRYYERLTQYEDAKLC
jgi:hypothetical protein